MDTYENHNPEEEKQQETLQEELIQEEILQDTNCEAEVSAEQEAQVAEDIMQQPATHKKISPYADSPYVLNHPVLIRFLRCQTTGSVN